ncbi:MAG: hypothetical protein ACI4RD_06960 [Kiritimatiellia bacterium]
MRRLAGVGLVLAAIGIGPASAGAAVATTAAPPRSRLELLAERLLPQAKLDEAAGFFAPVVRKYQPVLRSFQAEYRDAADKRAVALKYVPQAEAALADARRMRVPAKYEARKAEYVQLFETFVLAAKLCVQLGR